jgi:hypothetical protein
VGSKASSSGKRTKLGRSLLAGVKLMVRHLNGEIELPGRYVRVIPNVNVKTIREAQGFNQQEFARRYGLSLAFPPGMGAGAPAAGIGGACLHAGHSKPTSGGAEGAQGCSSLRRPLFLRRIDCAVAQIRSRREGEPAREGGTQATSPGGRTRQTREAQTRPMRPIRYIRPDSREP